MKDTEDPTVSNRSSEGRKQKDGVVLHIKKKICIKKKKVPELEKDLQNKRSHSAMIDEGRHCCRK